ncbi:MAG: hypothetical protein NTV51_12970 [Verrucomicrobia bacterium]|nr:hypothetical protein [Verrucomicrobiota bacterium]
MTTSNSKPGTKSLSRTQNSCPPFSRVRQWEMITDPDGRLIPRAKRHDDKTIAAIPMLW